MTWSLAVDASYDMPDPAAAAAANIAVIMGYLSDTPGKGLTAAYIQRAAAAGVKLLPLYETTSRMALAGRTGGITAANTATAIGRRLGLPPDVPIIYALDSNYTDTEMAGPVSAFVDGLHAVAGLDGEYGGYNQLGWLVAHQQDVGRLFQTYAWSAGRWLPSAQAPIEQYHNGVALAGGTVDLCRIDLSAITAWNPGDAMGFTADDLDVMLHTDGKFRNFPSRFDVKTNLWITLESAITETYEMANTANVNALAAIAAVKAIASPAVIAAAVLAELPAPATGGLTGTDVEAAVHAALGKLGIAVTVAP